jgi:hypothetical protein
MLMRPPLKTEILAVFFTSCLVGCTAVVPLASQQDDAAAKRQKVDPHRTLLIVYRENGLMGSAIAYPIFINDRVVGWLGPGTFLTLNLSPGTYSVGTMKVANTVSGPIGVAPVLRTLDAAPGREMYLKLAPRIGFPLSAELVLENRGSFRPHSENLQLVRFDSRGLTAARLVNTKLSPVDDSKPMIRGRDDPTGNNTAFKILGGVLLLTLLVLTAKNGGISHNRPSFPPNFESAAIQSDTASIPQVKLTQASENLISQLPDIRVSGRKIYGPGSLVWSVEEDRILGNDGSQYKIDGTRIYSNDGRGYRILGNNLLGDDGSSCVLISNQLLCK